MSFFLHYSSAQSLHKPNAICGKGLQDNEWGKQKKKNSLKPNLKTIIL